MCVDMGVPYFGLTEGVVPCSSSGGKGLAGKNFEDPRFDTVAVSFDSLSEERPHDGSTGRIVFTVVSLWWCFRKFKLSLCICSCLAQLSLGQFLLSVVYHPLNNLKGPERLEQIAQAAEV